MKTSGLNSPASNRCLMFSSGTGTQPQVIIVTSGAATLRTVLSLMLPDRQLFRLLSTWLSKKSKTPVVGTAMSSRAGPRIPMIRKAESSIPMPIRSHLIWFCIPSLNRYLMYSSRIGTQPQVSMVTSGAAMLRKMPSLTLPVRHLFRLSKTLLRITST